jgi:hypothetical protein
MDPEEMKNCFNKMQIQLPERDMHSLYRYCDIDRNKGIQYPEFIVLLCLTYLLTASSTENNVFNHVTKIFGRSANC